MSLKYKCLSVFLMFLSPTLAAVHGQSQAPHAVSFVQLLADAGKFDGQLVAVTGFLGLDPPDGNMLYLHKEDYDNGILLNGIGIEVSRQMWADREKLDMNYVIVVGVFRSGEKHNNQFNEITNVRTCAFSSQPSHPRREALRDLHKHLEKPRDVPPPVEK